MMTQQKKVTGSLPDSLIRDKKGRIVYTRRGGVERGQNYEWRDGYSATTRDGGVLYPWITKREAQGQARLFGSRAVFAEDE